MDKDIKYDYTFMTDEFVGGNGISFKDVESLKPKVSEIENFLDYDKLGLANEYEIKKIEDVSSGLLDKFENLVVVGAGGALRGALTLHQSLHHSHYNLIDSEIRGGLRIYFLGTSTDPNELHELFQQIDPKKTLFNIISKSGTTVETMSFYLYIRNLLKTQLGESYKDHLILTAGQGGSLREFAEKENGMSFEIPESVGDRYAILTVEGLFPASLIGIKIKELIRGAQNASKEIAGVFSCLQYLHYNKGRDIAVLMPYSKKLGIFAKWFGQIWAESLGKDLKGLTPIAGYGPDDQHSQLQLYQEGPINKTITFIKVENFLEDYHIPNLENLPVEDAKYFGNHSFAEIINIEHKATSLALMKHKRPNGTIILPEINEYYIGQLLYTFEIATVYLGKLLEINPFDQPGVEESKNLMYAELGRKGYEDKRKELKDLEKGIEKYVI